MKLHNPVKVSLFVCSLIFFFGYSQSTSLAISDVSSGTIKYIGEEYNKLKTNGFDGIPFETSKEKAKKIIQQKHPQVSDGQFYLQYVYPSTGCTVSTLFTFLNNNPLKALEVTALCANTVNTSNFIELAKQLMKKSTDAHGGPWKMEKRENGVGFYSIWKTKHYYLTIAYTPKRAFGKNIVPFDLSLFSRVGMRDDIVLEEAKDKYGF